MCWVEEEGRTAVRAEAVTWYFMAEKMMTGKAVEYFRALKSCTRHS